MKTPEDDVQPSEPLPEGKEVGAPTEDAQKASEANELTEAIRRMPVDWNYNQEAADWMSPPIYGMYGYGVLPYE